MNTEPKNTPQSEEFDLETGSVLLHKAALFSSLWTSETVETRVVWITLLLMADINGDVSASNAEIADAAKLSEEIVSRSVHRLSRPDPTSRIQDHDGRRLLVLEDCLRIVNYRHYNAEAHSKAKTRERNRNAQAAFRERLAASSDATISGGFDELWKLYPRHVGKRQALFAYNKALKRAEHEAIMDGLKNAVDAWSGTEPEFIPHPTTWLNGDRWEDTVARKAAPKPDYAQFYALKEQKAAMAAAMATHPGNREAIKFTGQDKDIKAFLAFRAQIEDITRRIAEFKL